MKWKIIILIFVIIVFASSVTAGTYGAGLFGQSAYSSGGTTPEPSPSPSPSGGTGGGGSGGGGSGGGGGRANLTYNTDFTVDKYSLKIALRQGETKNETLHLKNIGNSIFDVKAVFKELEKFKIYPESSELTTTLNPSEEKDINFVFKASENQKPDIYPVEITLKGPSTEKTIAAVFEVDSAQPLFDVGIDVLAESKSVYPGDNILLDVSLFNVRGFGRVDVSVEFSIKDTKGKVIFTEHETLAVETRTKFTRSLSLPSDLAPGNYVVAVKVIYGDSVGTSSALFEVKARTIKLYPIQINDYKTILLFGAGIIILAGLIFSSYRFTNLKSKKPQTKVEEIKQLRGEDRMQKLKKELEALEGAHKSGFISKESYEREKKRIEDSINTLK